MEKLITVLQMMKVGEFKSSISISLLAVFLTLNIFAFPVIALTSNGEYRGVTKSIFSENEMFYGRAVFQKGLSYSAWSSDAFSSLESDESLRLLTETNTDWIALCFSWFQTSTTSYDIHPDSSSPTIESIKHAITTAHNLGLKVMLKPMIEVLKAEEIRSYPVWRGEIQPSYEWFENYSSFINFFAELAEQNDVELFCVGCEYKATTGENEQWKNVINGVRQRYSGPIIYAADWTNFSDVKWWDSLDYVGIDAYFPLAFFNSDPTFEELKTTWKNHANEIEEWIATVNKPVIFTEIGYRSGDGTSNAPANYWFNMTVDLQEQHDCYEAAFQALWNRSWFYGFYWWTWTHKPAEGGVYDSGHSPQNKPAQDLITDWYSLERRIVAIDQIFVSAERCEINEVQLIGFHAKWEYDNSDVTNAKVYVNGTEYITNRTGWASFEVTYNTVGKRSWMVTNFQHPESSAYRVTTKDPSIVWDKVLFTMKADSFSLGMLTVKVKLTQAYNGAIVTGAKTFVNGRLCNEIEPGIYETTIDSWSPYEQVTVTVDTIGVWKVTRTTSIFNVMNIILYLTLVIPVIAAAALILKRHRRPCHSIE